MGDDLEALEQSADHELPEIDALLAMIGRRIVAGTWSIIDIRYLHEMAATMEQVAALTMRAGLGDASALEELEAM